MLVDAHTHALSAYTHVYILPPAEYLQQQTQAARFAVGAHPWDLLNLPAQTMAAIRSCAQLPGCVAIGETGLDRARGISWELQLQWFHWHWNLSEELRLPLVLHIVRSSSDLLGLMKQRRPKTPWQWHDFAGPLNVVKSAVKLHPELYFSFSPRGLARRDFAELWQAIPSDRRLLETDDSGSDLSVLYQAAKASESELEANFRRLFALA